MGLAGRKTKQRIGNDPRNLSWADGTYKSQSTNNVPFSLIFILRFLKMHLNSVKHTSPSLAGTRLTE